MDNLWDFFSAVFSHWVAIMSGLTSLALAFWERVKETPIGNRVFYFVGVFCLLLAFFLAWRDEHRAVLKAQQDLVAVNQELVNEKNKNTPSLHGNIDFVYSGDSPEVGGVVVIVLMSVKNLGSPSVVQGWTIHIKSQDVDISDSPTFLNSDTGEFRFQGIDETPTAIFRPEDFIYNKTIKPIERGSVVRGWLTYLFRGIKADQIRSVGTKYSISFSDVLDRRYTADFVWQGKMGLPSDWYAPGAGQPFVYPNKKTPSRR